MKYWLTLTLSIWVLSLTGQHFIIDNPAHNFLVDFNGASNLFLQLKENGSPRGYIGSYSGSADDFDLGTSSGNLTGDLHLTIRASPKMTLTSAGNLGIGTTIPTEKLHVHGNIRLQDDADMFGLDQIIGFNDLRFYGDPVDGPDLFIAANGNVGIGTTNPTETLHLHGTMKMADLLFFATASSFRMWGNLEPQDINPTFHNLDLGHTDHWWDDVYALEFKGPSDIRYKKDVEDLNYGLDELLRMRPVSFLWKHEIEDKRNYGLIAQELIQIIPEIVENSHESMGAGGPMDDSVGRYNVSYIELIPILIKAVQEQQEQIGAQKNEINNLKSQLAEISVLQERMDMVEDLLKGK